MRTARFLLSLIAALITGSCSKDPGQTEPGIESDIKKFFSLHNKIAAQFQASLGDFDMNNFDEYAHSDSLLAWIKSHPEVETAESEFPHAFYITHTNGLAGNILFNRRDDPDVSASFIRGGSEGAGSVLTHYRYSDDDKLITNDKMLIILAHSYDFYAPYCPAPDAKHIQDVVDLAEGGKADLEVTLRVDEGIDAFPDITESGFITLNTNSYSGGFIVSSNLTSQ